MRAIRRTLKIIGESMFIRLFFLFLFTLQTSAPTRAELIPLEVFKDHQLSLNTKLEKGYDHFTQEINMSPTVKLSARPIMDYILALSPFVEEQNVAEALDYLIKTGGPWGISKTPATPAEAFALISAAQSVQTAHPEVTAKNQDNASLHYQVVVALQKKEISLETGALMEAIKSSDPTFFTNNSQAYPKTEFWNDFLLFGFLMGAAPDIHGRYLNDIWNFDNAKLESQHNYIQWIFPIMTVGMGDGAKTPRVTDHTRILLQKHPLLLELIQQKMRLSLERMVTFWGQELEKRYSPNKIQPVVGQEAWQENWIVKTHNYLRMSRILTCLNLFGLKDERDVVWKYLDDTAKKDPRVKDSYNNYWKNAAVENLAPDDKIGYLRKQAFAVQEYINVLRSQGKPVRLVLGVSNTEEDLHDRFDESYVFLDVNQAPLDDSRALSANFNNLPSLLVLARTLPESFDEIIIDKGVFDALNWGEPFLMRIDDLLVPGGKFIFAPGLKATSYFDPGRNIPTHEEAIEEVKKSYINDPRFIHLWRLVTSLKVPFQYREQFDKNEFLKDELVPYQYVPFFEEVFGKGSVKVEYAKPLPFKVHPTDDFMPQDILITVTKPLEKK